MNKYITITGPTGAGKSTLTELVAKSWRWQALEEEFNNNPYWAKFYRNRAKWSFHSQVWFMLNSAKLTMKVPAMLAAGSVVQDMPLAGNLMYADVLRKRGEMTKDDWETYRKLSEVLVELLPAADLTVYLRVSPRKLMERISRRGREVERGTPLSYWRDQIEYFESWIEKTKERVLVIETDKMNFASGGRKVEEEVLAMIASELDNNG